MTSYVITHKELPSSEKIIFTHENPCTLLEKLRQEQERKLQLIKTQTYNGITELVYQRR